MTLKKLAELAHVSPSTASKALANSREVSEETVGMSGRWPGNPAICGNARRGGFPTASRPPPPSP